MQQFEDWLLEGQSINIVGLAGSGRTVTLLELEATLKADPAFWSPLRWTASDVLARSEADIGEELRSLQASKGIPVLLIDDFGELLVTAHGKRLEQRLFALVSGADPNVEGLRCVLVTTPRDRNIEVAGSGLRDRCKATHPARWRVSVEAVGRFGCTDDEQLLAFCGGTHLLVPCSSERCAI
ncbi:MAG: hypothetical protein IPL07_09875 [Acidimicrobiaceae bacterium]|nr:hypothetical protein [Acidimicrobiaceae bacterium]